MELSNRIQSATIAFLKAVLHRVQRDYEAGVEGRLLDLLENGIPGLLAGLVGDPGVVDARLDRLVGTAIKIELKGASLRRASKPAA